MIIHDYPCYIPKMFPNFLVKPRGLHVAPGPDVDFTPASYGGGECSLHCGPGSGGKPG